MKMIRSLLGIIIPIATSVLIFGQASQLASLNDPVALLAKAIDRGEVTLDYSADRWGYLPSLLKHLDINIDSQVLVFSKTSFQLSKISRQTPRAFSSMRMSRSGPFKMVRSSN